MGRRLNHEGSINKVKGRNLFQGQIWVVRADGRRYRKKIYGPTRREVQKKLRELRREQELGSFLPIEEETLRDYLRRWHIDPNLRPKTVHSRKVNLGRIIPHIGNLKVKDIKPSHIQGLYESLSKRLSKSSVYQTHAILRKALKDALKEGIITSNPMDRLVSTPKVERKEMDFLSQEEVANLFSLEDRWTPLWKVLVGTGIRIGEGLGLAWSSLDFETGSLAIRRSLQRVPGEGLVFQMPKTRKSSRTLIMPLIVVAALKEHRSRQLEQRLMLGPDWNELDLVFPNEWGEPMEPTRVNRALDKALLSVGIERHIRVHDLRHTAATLALREDIPVKVVQEMLGHSSFATTMDIYSHVDAGMQKTAAEHMNVALGG